MISMLETRMSSSIEQPLTVLPKSHPNFNIPFNNHLLITTSSCVWTWDSSGLSTIFQSSKSRIVAAREAQNGSGMLAVANRHVVVLHNVRRKHERSWGLESKEDEIRHLEYTSDAKSLYFSTSLTTSIQRYSTEHSQLLGVSRTHATPPVALAVSPTGNLMVSASDGPPIVYLHRLNHGSSPVLIEPRASRAAVAVASFHPERPNIFLLAFRDGTAAAYDASKIVKSGVSSVSNQENVNKGEICHITGLHRAASTGSKRAAISDAAFLPGFKTRALTVGDDGRCRIIDFAEGSETLRTWYARAPVTTTSILALKKSPSDARKGSASSTASHLIGGPTSTDSLIAIGRADGEVHIYDCVGLLLDQRCVGKREEKIISVEWVKGPSPKPIDADQNSMGTREPSRLTSKDETSANEDIISDTEIGYKRRRNTVSAQVERPLQDNYTKKQTSKTSSWEPLRKFTIHPDEVEESTVRRHPLADEAKPRPMKLGACSDLFAATEPSVEESASNLPEKRVTSPPRTRPALTDQTFLKSPDPSTPSKQDSWARRRNLELFPSTEDSPATAAGQELGLVTRKASLPHPKKRITFSDDSTHIARKSPTTAPDFVKPTQDFKAPANLPQPKITNANDQQHDEGFQQGGSINPDQDGPGTSRSRKRSRLQFLHRPTDHIEAGDLDSETALVAYEHVHKRHKWPDDSNQDSSLGGDLWLISDSGSDAKNSRVSKRKHMFRPPARQSSRSRVISKGTMSSTGRQPPTAASLYTEPPRAMDGSTDEEMFTADTHVTTSGTFTPNSKDVRGLFPRSSSLSPRKSKSSRKSTKRSPAAIDTQLRAVGSNEVAGGLPNSPWVRARASIVKQNNAEKTHYQDDMPRNSPFGVVRADWQKENLKDGHCSMCSATRARLAKIEAEMARLKGEILVMKTALRQQGITLPRPFPTR